MSYKDTLKIYQDLLSAGFNEAQAKIQAELLGESNTLMKKIENDLFWIRVIGASIALTLLSNDLVHWFK